MKVIITTQYQENYSDNPSTPHWKMKGEQIFEIDDFDGDSIMYYEKESIEAMKEMLKERSDDYSKYTYIAHELIFSDPIQLNQDKFMDNLRSIINSQNS